MTQPCRNFKECRGYAHDRKAKYCSKCWKKKLEVLAWKHGVENVAQDKKNLYIKFKS